MKYSQLIDLMTADKFTALEDPEVRLFDDNGEIFISDARNVDGEIQLDLTRSARFALVPDEEEDLDDEEEDDETL